MFTVLSFAAFRRRCALAVSPSQAAAAFFSSRSSRRSDLPLPNLGEDDDAICRATRYAACSLRTYACKFSTVRQIRDE
jgi:hypothetical protein